MEITAFCCHNSLYGISGNSRKKKVNVRGVRKIELPCSSRLDPLHVLKAFENGTDGVIVVACPRSVCRMIQGSARAASRVEYIKKLIGEAGLEPERIMLFSPEPPSADEFEKIVSEAAAEFEKLGPSPIKK